MFVPVVPYVPHTTIINKTIVYSDTVLPLKESGNNLKVVSISNVNEDSLEDCLKSIFSSNPDVIFNTIQYSKNDKKVYFYTNKEISTKEYEESKITTYKPLSKNQLVLEEVKKVISAPTNMESNYISLYDVSRLLRRMNNKYNSMTDRYEEILESQIKQNDNFDDSCIYIEEFDYDTKEIVIQFRYYIDEDVDYEEIRFAKKDGDIYVSKSESCWANELFAILYNQLSSLYDEFIKYEEYQNSRSVYGINTFNSIFTADISSFDCSINMGNDFELSLPSYEDEYSLRCNSGIVMSAIKGKEDIIFKNVFVEIDRCPKWGRSALIEIRQNQLTEQQRIEDERKQQETKQQKRLELKRKFFPWLKK